MTVTTMNISLYDDENNNMLGDKVIQDIEDHCELAQWLILWLITVRLRKWSEMIHVKIKFI